MSYVIQKLTPEAGAEMADQIDRNPSVRANVLATLSSHQVMNQMLTDRIEDLQRQLEFASHNHEAVKHNLQILVTALGSNAGGRLT